MASIASMACGLSLCVGLHLGLSGCSPQAHTSNTSNTPNMSTMAPAPWAVKLTEPGHSVALGIRLGTDTLMQAQQVLGTQVGQGALALVQKNKTDSSSAPPELEVQAYWERVELAGGIQGKVIAIAAAVGKPVPGTQAWLQQAYAQSQKMDTQSSGNRHWALAEAFRDAAWQLPVDALMFLPAAKLDREVVTQRFGQPAQWLLVNEAGQLLPGHTQENTQPSSPDVAVSYALYPSQGMQISLDASGQAVVQYVAPADFEVLLRQPLLKAVQPIQATVSTTVSNIQ